MDPALLKEYIAKDISVNGSDIKLINIEKRSIDARSKVVKFQVRGKAYLGEDKPNEPIIKPFIAVHDAKRVHIIGAGPAGLFAALRLIQLGIKPVIFERGREVRDRRRDVAQLNRSGILNPESNYCFGEGGAGTYSDGKLYTRSGKREDIETILNLLVHFGADPDITVDARPHIGTNRLPELIIRIRKCILESGGEIHFDQKLTDIHHQGGKISGITTNNTHRLNCDNIILATGHSARDIFYLLKQSGILIEPKPFALGIRVEHSQTLIDHIQYHSEVRGEYLPPAYYQVKEQVNDRGVFSFCMCPGGIIAPCSTEQEAIVVNGWSPSKRNNPYSNSGMVVEITLEDIPNTSGKNNPFYGLDFQVSIERLAAIHGGGNQQAPAQRLVDFVDGNLSTDLPKCSYLPGVQSANFSDILPSFILSRLKKSFPVFGKKMRGYFTNEAIVVGVESRTSSPIRIPRDSIRLEHAEITGLYPCGEGAGYAGGILSAAMDGFRVADAIQIKITQHR